MKEGEEDREEKRRESFEKCARVRTVVQTSPGSSGSFVVVVCCGNYFFTSDMSL